MIRVFNARSGDYLGDVSEAQFDFMHEQLEEESVEDQDYYINQATIDLFETRGADPALVSFLRRVLGSQEDIDIRWEPAQ